MCTTLFSPELEPVHEIRNTKYDTFMWWRELWRRIVWYHCSKINTQLSAYVTNTIRVTQISEFLQQSHFVFLSDFFAYVGNIL